MHMDDYLADLSIGGELYRLCPLEKRIKIKTAAGGWKLYRKFAKEGELAKYWDDLSEAAGKVPVRECVEASAVLPPEAAAPYAPEAVTAQYRRAVAGALEMVRFGAMLVEVENVLTCENIPQKGCTSGGQGLQAWLEQNCPDVNYKTAMRFKHLAEGVQRHCRLPATVPLSLAMPGPEGEYAAPEGACPITPARLKKLQKEVWALVEGKSARQLQFAFAAPAAPVKGGARDGAGRPMIKQADSVTLAGAAWELIGRSIDRATAWHFERFLPESIAREACSTVDLLSNALKARLQEFGKGAANVNGR